MLDEPRPVAVAVLLGLVVAAGCLGGPSQGGSAAPETTASGEVLTVSRANGTAAERAPNATTTSFDALSADRQDEFLAALDDDVRDPTAWGPGTDVEYVRYEGTWYWVTVVVEN